jgi:hypothetical protein
MLTLLIMVSGAPINAYTCNVSKFRRAYEYMPVVRYSNTITSGESGTRASSAARHGIIPPVDDACQSMEGSSEAG